MTSVVLVEDDARIRANLVFQLRQEGLEPRAEENAEAVLVELEDPERRELRSLCERLVVLGADRITVEQLPDVFGESRSVPPSRILALDEHATVLPFRQFKEASEKEYLEHVLARTGWNVSAAARLLGIQRSHLHQKLSRLGARRPEPECDR